MSRAARIVRGEQRGHHQRRAHVGEAGGEQETQHQRDGRGPDVAHRDLVRRIEQRGPQPREHRCPPAGQVGDGLGEARVLPRRLAVGLVVAQVVLLDQVEHPAEEHRIERVGLRPWLRPHVPVHHGKVGLRLDEEEHGHYQHQQGAQLPGAHDPEDLAGGEGGGRRKQEDQPVCGPRPREAIEPLLGGGEEEEADQRRRRQRRGPGPRHHRDGDPGEDEGQQRPSPGSDAEKSGPEQGAVHQRPEHRQPTLAPAPGAPPVAGEQGGDGATWAQG